MRRSSLTPCSVEVRVQHHPSRAHLLDRLAASLGDLSCEVVADPGGKRPIAWRTYRECLLRADCNAAYTLILQDDALPCPGFPQALRSALGSAEGHPVALFTPRTALKSKVAYWQAQAEGKAWCVLDKREWVSVVALCWPAPLIPRFLAWADSRGYGPQRWRADDAIVGEFMRTTGTQVLATIPCLVEHPDVEPSLTNSRGGWQRNPRLALAFASEGAHDVDWSAR